MSGLTNITAAAAAASPVTDATSASASAASAASSSDGIWDDAELIEYDPTDEEINTLGRVPSYHTLAEQAGVSPLGRAPTYTTIQRVNSDGADVISLSTACHSEDNSRSATPTGSKDDEKSEKKGSDISPPAYDGPSDEEPIDEKKDVPEEVPADIYIDTLLEEIINDWSNGGPFVHRLTAYRTPSGEIVIRREKTKIENGTKLKMGVFEDCEFCYYGGKWFLSGKTYRDSIDLFRSRASMSQGNSTWNISGGNKKLNVGSKANSTYHNSNGVSYDFKVEGRTIRVSDDGTILSDSQGSSTFNTHNFSQINDFSSGSVYSTSVGVDMSGFDESMSQLGREMSQMGRDLGQMGRNIADDMNRMARGLNREMAQMNRDLSGLNQGITSTSVSSGPSFTRTFTNARGGRTINYSGSGTQFNSSSGMYVGGTFVGQTMTIDEDGNVTITR